MILSFSSKLADSHRSLSSLIRLDLPYLHVPDWKLKLLVRSQVDLLKTMRLANRNLASMIAGPSKERWQDHEKRMFFRLFKKYGVNYSAIATVMKTRTK